MSNRLQGLAALLVGVLIVLGTRAFAGWEVSVSLLGFLFIVAGLLRLALAWADGGAGVGVPAGALAVVLLALTGLVVLRWPGGAPGRPLPPPASPPAVAAPAPPAPTPALPPPRPGPLRYQVRAGDNVTQVGLFFGVRVEDIIALNNLPRDGKIFPGQELLIPARP